MGLPSYMLSVVDLNVVMRRMTVLRTGEYRDSGWVSLNIREL